MSSGAGLPAQLPFNVYGVKVWRYRFKLAHQGAIRESMLAIGDYATAPHGETPEEATARRNGGRFTLAEARGERAKALNHEWLASLALGMDGRVSAIAIIDMYR